MDKNWFYSLKGDKLIPRKPGAVFIVLEGPDGAGKTTQAKLLKTYLESLGREVLLTKEPTTDTEAGRRVREILNSSEKKDPEYIQKLFIEDRKEHVSLGIIPALSQGKTVVCDRYFFSTFAYGYIDNQNIETLVDLNKDFIVPDMTFVLAVDPEKCVERLRGRVESIDHFEKVEKLQKVNEAYKMLVKKYKNIKLIDGEGTIKSVSQEIIKLVDFLLK